MNTPAQAELGRGTQHPEDLLRWLGWASPRASRSHSHYAAWHSDYLPERYYPNPRVKWSTRHPHIRKERECVGHPAIYECRPYFLPLGKSSPRGLEIVCMKEAENRFSGRKAQ